MNASEAVTTHKARFPELASLSTDTLVLFAQAIAREEEQHRQEMEERHCAVCFNLLTPEEQAQHGGASFHRTCATHKHFRTRYDLTSDRRKLGLFPEVKFPPFWKL